MEIWSMWTQFLQASLGFLSAHFGLSEAVSIITLTVVARMALMPLSVAAAYRSQKSKEAMERLKPQLETLRETYKDDPSELAARTMALQRANGITIFDKVSVLNTATLPSAIGLYWATSNALTVIQTLVLSSLLARRHAPLAA